MKGKSEIKELEKAIQEQLGNDAKIVDINDEYELGCSSCGNCCKNRQDVIISPFALREIAMGLGMKTEEVIVKYMEPYIGENSKLVQMIIRFKEKVYTGDTVCPFLKKKEGKSLCSVHEFKPSTCRTYPFGKFTSKGKAYLFLPVIETTCSNATEHSLIKVKDWAKTEHLEKESAWAKIDGEKIDKLFNIKGYKELVETDENLFILSVTYRYCTDISVGDDEALAKFDNDSILEAIKIRVKGLLK